MSPLDQILSDYQDANPDKRFRFVSPELPTVAGPVWEPVLGDDHAPFTAFGLVLCWMPNEVYDRAYRQPLIERSQRLAPKQEKLELPPGEPRVLSLQPGQLLYQKPMDLAGWANFEWRFKTLSGNPQIFLIPRSYVRWVLNAAPTIGQWIDVKSTALVIAEFDLSTECYVAVASRLLARVLHAQRWMQRARFALLWFFYDLGFAVQFQLQDEYAPIRLRHLRPWPCPRKPVECEHSFPPLEEQIQEYKNRE